MSRERVEEIQEREAGTVLLPCPFCGGKPADINPTELHEKWLVECTDCAAAVIFDSRPHAAYRVATYEEAIAAWNRRVSSGERELTTLREALEPFAAMDRTTCDLKEYACVRGIASDMTVITSGDFRNAAKVLEALSSKSSVATPVQPPLSET